uniref:Uncharacterized protein n=1 Tax=Brassica oleracea TaxID=3712 RepID=A0A3P6FZ05_BRAOL|nr:unnamed protein product [Brassica oleracea]
MDDPLEVRRTPPPDDSIVGETEGLKQEGKKRKRTHPHRERESGHQNDDDHAKEKRSPTTHVFHHPAETKAIRVLTQLGDDVEPESYVLPAEHAVTSPGAWQKRNPTYRYEQGSPVAWEKTKPNCYSSVGSVRSFHPSWDGNSSSKSKVASTGIETCPLLIIS